MKKILVLSVLSLAVFTLSGLMNNAVTYTSGAPAGYTGSPGDGGATCGSNGGCHGGGVKTKAGLISSNVPSTGYIPGFTYTITANIASSFSSKFGFQISPQATNGALIGSLIITNPAEMFIVSGKYVEQKAAGCSGAGSRTWSFNWKAPNAGTGAVTFYGAFNATNSNSSTSGDSIFKSTLTIAEDPNTGMEPSLAADDKLRLYPNPTNGELFLELAAETEGDVTVRLSDLQGKEQHTLFSGKKGSGMLTERFSLEGYAPGIYLIFVESGSTRTVKRVLLQ